MNSELRKKIWQIYSKILDTTSEDNGHKSDKKALNSDVDSRHADLAPSPESIAKKNRL